MPEERQRLLETFKPEEQEKIRQLVSELHRIRKIDSSKDVIEQIEEIAEQEFFYVGDFIIENGFMKDREKVETLWKYLEGELS